MSLLALFSYLRNSKVRIATAADRRAPQVNPKPQGRRSAEKPRSPRSRYAMNLRPPGEFVRSYQGNNSDLTGKEFRFSSERVPPSEKLDVGEHDRRSTYFKSFDQISGNCIMSSSPILRSNLKLL